MTDFSMLPYDYRKLTRGDRRWVRGLYIQKQYGLCHHCKQPLDKEPSAEVRAKPVDWRIFPPNFLRYPVHLHHNHQTGMTIGAVHALCNAVLFQYHGE